MSRQSPLPYAFAQREDFLKLPLDRRTAHLWHAHEFCRGQLGQQRFTDDELNRNIRVLRRMMLQVAKSVAGQLQEDGSWRDAEDARWPRHHKGADPEHWYDSGAFPPQFIALPEDPTGWREVLSKQPEVLFEEMIAWAETPAGQAGVDDAELQKLLTDRDTYIPKPKEAEEPFSEDPEKSPDVPADRVAGLGWLSDKSADGLLDAWSHALKLPGIEQFLRGTSSNRRNMDRMLPELMKLEHTGEWEALQKHLDVESPRDGAQLARLRSCLPKSRV